VTPTPDEAPPIVLGGLARPAVRRAARIGDGWCANEMLSLDDVETRVEDIERIREEEGIDGEFTVYAIQYGFVGDSYEAAWETMREVYFYQQRKYAEWDEGGGDRRTPCRAEGGTRRPGDRRIARGRRRPAGRVPGGARERPSLRLPTVLPGDRHRGDDRLHRAPRARGRPRLR